MAERSRLQSIGNENDFQIVCGNMYSAIFMMNSSGYGESISVRLKSMRIDGLQVLVAHFSDVHECRSRAFDRLQVRRDLKRYSPSLLASNRKAEADEADPKRLCNFPWADWLMEQ